MIAVERSVEELVFVILSGKWYGGDGGVM